jgi:hypothetical protein
MYYKSWNSLTDAQRDLLEACPHCRCGVTTNKIFRLPQFCFTASCCAHDYSFCHGGWIRDFVRANNGFVKRMYFDIYMMDDAYLNKAFHYLMASLYYVAVSTFGIFFFSWGRYKTFDEILTKKKCI